MTTAHAHIEYVRRRLSRVFASRPILPLHGIQYRLAEVGPSRFDPRELNNALSVLPEGRSIPTAQYHGLIADPELSKFEAGALAEKAIRTMRRIAAIDHNHLIEKLSEELASTLGKSAVSELAMEASPTVIASGLTVPRTSTVIETGDLQEPRTRCWVTHELPWIYPDDPRLWRLLTTAARENSSAIVVARKVAPATFAICKVLGATALQFYLPLLPTPNTRLAASADRLGWPPFGNVELFADHPVIDRIRAHRALEREGRRPSRGVKVEAAIREAAARRFDTVPFIQQEDLIEWATNAALALPPVWFAGVGRWNQQYEPIAQGGLPSLAPAQRTGPDSPGPTETYIIRGPSIAAEVDAQTFDALKGRAVPRSVRMK